MRRPSSQTSPASAVSSPAMILSKVDLPDPDGPRNAMNSRASSASDTSSSTGVTPKDLRTPFSSRLGTPTLPSGSGTLQQQSRPATGPVVVTGLALFGANLFISGRRDGLATSNAPPPAASAQRLGGPVRRLGLRVRRRQPRSRRAVVRTR